MQVKQWLKERGGRQREYAVVLTWFAGSSSVLDVGCGTGSFLKLCPNAQGIDINPDNVAICREQGLNAEVGSALDIPFPDGSFDAIFLSHVFHVFAPDEAAQFMREAGRILKRGGILAISTLLPDKRFWQHPENTRPYPPSALMRYGTVHGDVSSPMWPNMPTLVPEAIWLRKRPLIRLWTERSGVHGLTSRSRDSIRLSMQ